MREQAPPPEPQPKIFRLRTLLILGVVALLIPFVGDVVDARRDARNDARNETALAYIRALDLVRKDSGRFPTTEGACLGTYPDGRCWQLDLDTRGDVAEDQELNGRLKPFVELTTGDTISAERVGARTAYEGYLYRAPEGGSFTYEIEWMLEGARATCLKGARVTHKYNDFEMTHCVYTRP